MQRRAVLATLGSVVLAGCGWNQTREGNGSTGDGDADDDGTSDSGDGSGSEGGEESTRTDTGEQSGNGEPIRADPEQLLLGRDALGPEWSRTETQTTKVCNAFQRDAEAYTFILESCATVYDDEETAVEEYESDLDGSRNLLTEQLDLEPDIGDQAAVFWYDDLPEEEIFRVQFRDTNATGLVDFTIQRAVIESGAIVDQKYPEDRIPDRDESDAVDLAATMHDSWRS